MAHKLLNYIVILKTTWESHMKKLILAVATFAAFTMSAAARAELVTNGGFETGNFSGWTQSGNTGFSGVSS
jgi:hypothetical protein